MSRILSRKLTTMALFFGLLGGPVLWTSAASAAPPRLGAPPPVDDEDDYPPPVKKKKPAPSPVDDEDDYPPPVKKKKVARGGLEPLLRETGLEYERVEGEMIMYRVSVPTRGKPTTVMAVETTIGTMQDGSPITVGIIGLPVHTYQQGDRPTNPLYKAVAEMNDQVAVGRVSATRQGVLFCSSFFLRSADGQMLSDHISVVLNTQKEVRKRLAPYLDDTGSE